MAPQIPLTTPCCRPYYSSMLHAADFARALLLSTRSQIPNPKSHDQQNVMNKQMPPPPSALQCLPQQTPAPPPPDSQLERGLASSTAAARHRPPTCCLSETAVTAWQKNNTQKPRPPPLPPSPSLRVPWRRQFDPTPSSGLAKTTGPNLFNPRLFMT